MALEFRQVGFRYGQGDCLTAVDLSAAPGKLTCLLGASGSGKSTLLRLAAGLLPMQAGEIHLDGQTLANPGASPPPEKRPVGLLFQEGALFPHITVAQNVAYGVGPLKTARPAVEALLEQVGLTGFAERYPHMLSGGQQQRVALARALAPRPRVLLMDEPFGSVDIVLRQQLRALTRRVLAEHDCIALLVTHDPEEAMTMADHIAMLEDGQIVQAGDPAALYDEPKSVGVARMIGGGTEVAGQIEDGRVRTVFGDWPIGRSSRELPPGPCQVVIREAPLSIEPCEDGLTVVDQRLLGLTGRLVIAAASGELLTATVLREAMMDPGAEVRVSPGAGAIHVFPKSDSK